MELANSIRDYYFKNFSRLSEARQFHFASRLAAWEGSPEAAKKLQGLRGYLLADSPKETLHNLLGVQLGPIYKDEARRPYFNRYPSLHGLNTALFRIRHLKYLFNIDLREVFLELVDRQTLKDLNQSLRKDHEALRWLSSFGVNHLYLSELLFGPEFELDPQLFIEVMGGYDLQDPVQFNLAIYLLTHCIIADSNFYFRHLPGDRRPTYQQMLEIMDRLIAPGAAKLDAELEYLVASRIYGRPSPLQAMIYKQLPPLLSQGGDYLTEPSGNSESAGPNSLDASEHRNVLYIMSTSEYSPKK